MAAANPILTPDRGKAHSVALAVLCVLAGVQVMAMVRAVWLAKSKQGSPAVAASHAGSGQTSLPGAPPLPASAATPTLMPPPAVPAATPRFTVPPSVPSATSGFTSQTGSNRTTPSAQSVAPLSAQSAASMTAELRELIDLAQQLRPLGDLQGAIEVLRRADTTSPDHPAVLKEMALTFELMGLKDKAAAARQRAASLSSTAALTAAKGPDDPSSAPVSAPTDAPGRALSAATGLTTPDARPHDPAKTLGIGACELLRDRFNTRGEKVTLRLPIRSQPGQAIDPSAIDIDVFFFDLVNGEKVEQTKADVPVNTWVDAPVDWKDGQERLDVVYSMPEMTADVIRSIGQRKFHGYIVKLYYQHKLQDTVMEPASLQHFGTGSAPQPTGNPLLPPVAR